MRRIPGCMMVCVVGLGFTGLARGLDAPLAGDPEKARKVGAILAEWERKNAPITRLDATFKLVDVGNGSFKRKTEYEGRFLFKDPNLASYEVRKLDPEAPGRPASHERCLWTGDEFVQIDEMGKTINIFPTKGLARAAGVDAKPKVEKRKNLFAGLFDFRALALTMAFADWHPAVSFLIHMKAEAFQSRYSVALMAESPKVYRLRVVPKGEVDRLAFSSALIDLNKQTYLPDAIQLLSPDGWQTQTYRILAIKPNAPIDDANFKVREPVGWKVIRNPDPGEPGPHARGLKPPEAEGGPR